MKTVRDVLEELSKFNPDSPMQVLIGATLEDFYLTTYSKMNESARGKDAVVTIVLDGSKIVS